MKQTSISHVLILWHSSSDWRKLIISMARYQAMMWQSRCQDGTRCRRQRPSVSDWRPQRPVPVWRWAAQLAEPELCLHLENGVSRPVWQVTRHCLTAPQRAWIADTFVPFVWRSCVNRSRPNVVIDSANRASAAATRKLCVYGNLLQPIFVVHCNSQSTTLFSATSFL